MHDAVTAAWEQVLADWDNQARHDALLVLVVEHNGYTWAAARYKERDDEVAKRQLAKLRNAATATMFASATVKPSPDASPYKRTMIWFAVMVAMLLLGLVFAAFVTKTSPSRDTTHVRP